MLLHDIEVTNFRSIKGRILAPLDAKIVLVHGENGAGKTSLLSAIELALTGRVLSLQRADPTYERQLLHWSTTAGRIQLTTDDEAFYNTALSSAGASGKTVLPEPAASFFTERCYLPQSLLGQLLQIYQSSNEELDSPLARFVGELLGLDRLDAIDAGLKPLADLRNFRKIAEGYGGAEAEKSRLERLLADHRRNLTTIEQALDTALNGVATASAALGLNTPAEEGFLDRIEAELSSAADEQRLSRLADDRRRLDAIRREASRDRELLAQADEAALTVAHSEALAALDAWRRAHEDRIAALRKRVEALLPTANLPTSADAFQREAVRLLRTEQQQAAARTSGAAKAADRRAAAESELEVARKQLLTIDTEIGRITPTSGDLGAVLAEITSYISDDVCPVCDRDFSDMEAGSLADHVHAKVRTLSTSAQRLLDLSRTRGQQTSTIERLERELATLASQQLDPAVLVDLSRSSASLDAALTELETAASIIADGERLTQAETSARRALAELQSRSLARASLMVTLKDFAVSVGQDPPGETEAADGVLARLSASLEQQSVALNERTAARRTAGEGIRKARAEIVRRSELTAVIATDEASLKRNTDALARANTLRTAGQTIRTTVETVRAQIIRREFNERLNKLWRDLFIRLAPSEPFVPAFKIPETPSPRLQPKLITEHRGGGSGGTPGAMLSAGNLNTAALTLFIALHLTVPAQLPWLILDDPVQSMDDVHIANFAALLRTLAKEHDRQLLIAVHDRQLFEYLRLELSPAYPDDSLLSLELSRGANRDSLCIADRRSFHEETALRVAA